LRKQQRPAGRQRNTRSGIRKPSLVKARVPAETETSKSDAGRPVRHGPRHAHYRHMHARAAEKCRQRFLRFFPEGFADETYIDWERSYKADAHQRWNVELNQAAFRALLKAGKFDEIATRAIRIESRTNLLFSFEKMALRDAVRSGVGARRFAEGLFAFLHGRGTGEQRFEEWCEVIDTLPRRQTRVLTWPVVTVFGFIAQADRHIFLKPNVTRTAALQYGYDLDYKARPNWNTYSDLLAFSAVIRSDLRDMRPRDMIDVQSFMWVQGSDEYRGRAFRSVQTTRVRSA
jgi:hypothetical protein